MENLIRTIVLGLLLWPLACTTDSHPPGVLELRLLTKEIHRPVGTDFHPCLDSCPEIIYELSNNSDRKLLLYNFKRNFNFAIWKEELACDTLGNGLQIYLFKDTTFIPSTLGLHDSLSSHLDVPRTRDILKTWYRNSRIVLDVGQHIEFRQKIDFRNYYLPPGTYYFILGYRQVGIPPEITSEELASDLGDATLFGGCVRTDSVKLVVGTPRDSSNIMLEQVEVRDKS